MTLVGVDTESALFAAWTSIGNIGYGYGPLVARTGTFIDFPDAAKWLMIVAMLMGRLGLLAIFVLVLPRFWRALSGRLVPAGHEHRHRRARGCVRSSGGRAPSARRPAGVMPCGCRSAAIAAAAAAKATSCGQLAAPGRRRAGRSMPTTAPGAVEHRAARIARLRQAG